MKKRFVQAQNLKWLLFSLVLLSFNLNAQCPNELDTNKLDGQQEVDAFLANNPNCDYLFELELTGDVHDISGFLTLKSVRYLYINACPNLLDLSGFSNIDSIHGNLGFYDTEGLENLCGLSSLKYIGNDLRLEETKSIVSLDGIESLVAIDDDITIEGNLKLANLDGIQNVNQIGGNSVDLFNNSALVNCCGIKNILNNSTIDWLTIENNPSECSNVEEIINTECTFTTSECTTSSASIDFVRQVEVYPNPVDDFLRIENNSPAEITQLVLYNSIGQQVIQDNGVTNYLETGNLPKGFYVLEVKIDHQSQLYKVMIQH